MTPRYGRPLTNADVKAVCEAFGITPNDLLTLVDRQRPSTADFERLMDSYGT